MNFTHPIKILYRQKMRILLLYFSGCILALTAFFSGTFDTAFCQPHLPITIAFASDFGGNWDIYLTDSHGKKPVNLTQNPAADYYPSWSPDGKQIAFFSRRDANHELYVMHADGTNQRRLTHHPATDKAPSWSPDGTQLAFSSNREGHFNIYILELKRNAVKNLTKNEFLDGIPIWSPDGKKVAYHSQRDFNWDIYIIDTATRQERRLTEQPLMDTYATWSPDGRQIVYSSMRQDVDQADFDLYIMDAVDGGNKKALTDTPFDEAVPAWSPDGNMIAFQSEQDGRWVIHLMNSDGSERRELINNNGWTVQPKWQNSSDLPVRSSFLQINQWGKIKTPHSHKSPND